MKEKQMSEWFSSENSANSANSAAVRLQSMGYVTSVRYAMHADGSHDWLLEAF